MLNLIDEKHPIFQGQVVAVKSVERKAEKKSATLLRLSV